MAFPNMSDHISRPALRPRPVGLTLAGAALVLVLAGCSDTSPPAADGEAAGQQTNATGSSNVEIAAAPAGRAPEAVPAPAEAAPGEVQELEWDSLIPDDYRPDALMAEYAIDDISDDDPRAAELMERLRELWDQAPVREELDGAQIKLPGFIVPVETTENETTGFLLVPYYGACIHVPPPPANQTVYVVSEAGKGTAPELFDVVWVTGMMSVNRIENDIAEAGYTIYASEIAPYDETL
jgi:hypothetical protein